MEFAKRLDPSLPFYYYSTSDRFYEGDMPNFNKTPDPEKPKKSRRAPRREQIGANVSRRITMASRGSGSVRATFHNFPVDLPPPPSRSSQSFMSDHPYAASGPSSH